MTQKNVFNPIYHEMVSTLAPWHSYVGGPFFPEKPLYSRDNTFDAVNNVSATYDSKNKLKSVIVESKSGEKASVEFELLEEQSKRKMICYMKKNNSTELILTEWIENQQMFFTLRKPNFSAYDVDISVLPVNGDVNEFDVEIKFNNKTFQQKIKAKSLDVPLIALDFAKEISSLQSNVTIAAANPQIIGIITMEAYKMFHQENRNIIWHIVNLIISIIVHILTVCWGGILAHIISLLLIPEELEE